MIWRLGWLVVGLVISSCGVAIADSFGPPPDSRAFRTPDPIGVARAPVELCRTCVLTIEYFSDTINDSSIRDITRIREGVSAWPVQPVQQKYFLVMLPGTAAKRDARKANLGATTWPKDLAIAADPQGQHMQERRVTRVPGVYVEIGTSMYVLGVNELLDLLESTRLQKR